MDNNSTILLINLLIDNWRGILGGLGFVIALFLGVVGFVVRHFWNDLKNLKNEFNNLGINIAKLEARLNTLEDKKGLHGQVKEIYDEYSQKLQQRATELHDSTKAQLDHLVADIKPLLAQVHTSLDDLKNQPLV